MKIYRFYGWKTADAHITEQAAADFPGILTPRDLYDILLHLWSAKTCAPRLREKWNKQNPMLGQCSVTAFLAQDLFGGSVYGILRPGGNYHCYNAVPTPQGICVFDLTSEQFGEEVLCYADNPEQLRSVHFAKEEKRLRYEALKAMLYENCQTK